MQPSVGLHRMTTLQDFDRPIVLGLMGVPGAGKSHLATRLIRETGWVLLNRDQARHNRFPDGRSDRAATDTAEAILAEQLRQTIAAGHSLVLDGMTLARRSDRCRWADRAYRAGGIWRLVFLDCPLETAISRVEADRKTGRHPATDRNISLVRAVAKRLEPPGNDEPALVLQEGNPPEGVLEWLALAR